MQGAHGKGIQDTVGTEMCPHVCVCVFICGMHMCVCMVYVVYVGCECMGGVLWYVYVLCGMCMWVVCAVCVVCSMCECVVWCVPCGGVSAYKARALDKSHELFLNCQHPQV